MKNRQNIINIIRAKADKELMFDLRQQMNIKRDYNYDLADALNDVKNIAESNRDFSVLKKARAIIIEAGGYAEMTTGDIFIFDKKKYGWPYGGGWVAWIDEEVK